MSIDTSKIIHGVVGGGRYTVTSPIVKEDYGLYLLIEGLELPSTYEVDFSNSEHNGTSVTMIGNSDGVLIPNQFISSGKDVFAFLYHVGVDFGRTVYKFRIPNKLRPDRTDDVPTPEEQSTIDQCISALNSAVEQTAQDVQTAHGYAQASASNAESASASAQSADASREAADESEYNAQVYAEQAQASATASANSASQAEQIKTDVQGLVSEAQGYANSASQSATNAQTYALSANAASGTAENFADAASGYATSAQSSAQTASTKASEASTSAQTAFAKATESVQSASQALTYKTDAESAKTASQTAQGLAESARDDAIDAKADAESARDTAQSLVDSITGKVEQIDSNTERIESLEDDRYKPYVTDTASGSIASFPDGADDIPLKSLVVDINPVQDLHGYDSPWVAGGGKNLLDPTLLKDQAGWNVIPFYAPVDTVLTMSTNNTDTSASTGLPAYFRQPSGAQSTANMVYANHPITQTVGESGYVEIVQRNPSNTVSYADFQWQIEVGSTATDWTPYENICPISGWTECNINATGKNLLDADKYYGNYKQSDGSYLLTGNILTNIRIPLKAFIGKTVTFSATATIGATPTNLRVRARVNGAWINGNTATNNSTSTISVTATPVTGADYIYITFGSGGTGTVTLRNVQLEEGSAVTDYESFGTPITISLGQTVFGARIDVLSGVMRVDRAMTTFDGSESIWSNYATRNGFSTGISDMFVGYRQNGISNYLVRNPSSGQCGFWLGVNNQTLYVLDVVGNIIAEQSATEWMAYLAEHPLQILYPLATPIEIQLSPTAVKSLLGVNNIFADTGDTSVEYRANTKLYIDRLTEPDADMIADSNITSGKYFMVGNNLYLATANIASGASVIVGTNATRKSLSEALNEINA